MTSFIGMLSYKRVLTIGRLDFQKSSATLKGLKEGTDCKAIPTSDVTILTSLYTTPPPNINQCAKLP